MTTEIYTPKLRRRLATLTIDDKRGVIATTGRRFASIFATRHLPRTYTVVCRKSPRNFYVKTFAAKADARAAYQYAVKTWLTTN